MEIFKKAKTEEAPVFERKIPLYSIRDRHVGFTPPIPMENDDYAKRYLKTQVLENPTMKDSPEDFTLYKVGSFETISGITHGIEPQLIVKGVDYVSD